MIEKTAPNVGFVSTAPAFAQNLNQSPIAMARDVASAAAGITGPLGATVNDYSKALSAALGGANDRVSSARLDGAMLDFAREAKALTIGNPDAAPGDLKAVIDSATEFGEAKVNALPDVGFTALDRAVTFFSEAAQALSSQPSLPLFDQSIR
jgi:hypothetical protein